MPLGLAGLLMRFPPCADFELITRTVVFVSCRAQIKHDLNLRSLRQRYPLTFVSAALSLSLPLKIYVKLLA